jgi:plasmid stabilization system protein ParE
VDRSVAWTESAADEFDAAAAYRAQASVVYASALAAEFRAASRSLRQMAERGRVVPELGDSAIREIFVKGYRMVYKVSAGRVWILALVSGRRDFLTAWREKARGSAE